MPRNEGFALFFVLSLAVMLASIVGSVLQVAMVAAGAAAVNTDIIEADGLAGSVADLVIAYRGAHPQQQRVGAFEAALDRAQLAVSYRDEAARIDINEAPVELIVALAAAVGGEPDAVTSLDARLRRVRSIAGRAETGEGRLFDPVEIVGRFGVDSQLARRMLPALTTHGNATLDPLLAGPAAISALFSSAPDRAADFLAKRSMGFAARDAIAALLPAEARGFIGFGPSPSLRATATVRLRAGLSRRYEVIFAPAPGDAGALIHAWRHAYDNEI